MQTTKREYETFQYAFDYFNRILFGDTLPQVLITLQRKSKAYGYFCAKRFSSRSHIQTIDGTPAPEIETIDELAMNPDGFVAREDRDILSTLVHEMVHVWQQHHGKAPRRCYHDKQWAKQMELVGLMPSSTGQPGGKKTGPKMTHYIMKGGAYDAAYKALVEQAGFELIWQSAPIPKEAPKPKSKVKYSCGGCGINAWGKPGSNLLCGDCYEANGEVSKLGSEDDEGEEKKAA